MGYCYTRSGELCCDGCGTSGGVRRRTCPHKVNGLPYCPPPALCSGCYAKHGGAKLHAGCKAKAAARQREEDDKRKLLDAGYLLRSTAWGDWHPAVPKGLVGVRFVGNDRQEFRLLPQEGYNAHQWLHEYAAGQLQEWPGHPDCQMAAQLVKGGTSCGQ